MTRRDKCCTPQYDHSVQLLWVKDRGLVILFYCPSKNNSPSVFHQISEKNIIPAYQYYAISSIRAWLVRCDQLDFHHTGVYGSSFFRHTSVVIGTFLRPRMLDYLHELIPLSDYHVLIHRKAIRLSSSEILALYLLRIASFNMFSIACITQLFHVNSIQTKWLVAPVV